MSCQSDQQPEPQNVPLPHLFRFSGVECRDDDLLTEKIFLSSGELKVYRWKFGVGRSEAATSSPGGVSPENGADTLWAEVECSTHAVRHPRSVTATLSSVLKLLTWSVEPQTSEKFPCGRIGLWFPPDNTLSHCPTRQSGYQIDDIVVNGASSPTINTVTIKLGYHGKLELHNVFEQ